MLRAITYVGQGLLCVAVVLCLAVAIAPEFVDGVYYEGPQSARYDGTRLAIRTGTTR